MSDGGLGGPGGGGKPQPRMGGGFNSGMGSMGGFGEHMDENAMQQAMGQKQLAQQATSQQSAIQAGQGGGKAQTDFTQQQAEAMQAAQGAPGSAAAEGAAKQKPPRAMGSLTDELLKRPVQDIIEGIKSLFDINALLGINPQADSPQDQAKKKQLHQRWQQLNQEQQQVAQQKYQQEMQKKQAEEEEKQRRKQQEAAAASQTIQAPSSPKKGPDGGGGSKKQKAVTKLQNDRKTLSGPSSSN